MHVHSFMFTIPCIGGALQLGREIALKPLQPLPLLALFCTTDQSKRGHQLNCSPSNSILCVRTLPAKNPAEEHRHQRMHQQMMAAARKKELQKAKEEVKKEKMKRERDKLVADSLVEWEKILLKWESM